MPIGLLDIEASGEDVVLSWDSFAGQIYKVQDKSDLTSPAWNAYTNVMGLSGTTSITIETDEAGFYQVISD